MNMSIDPSVSRRVYFLLVGEQSLVDYWFLDLQLSIAPQDVGMRWRRVSSNIYAHSLLALRHTSTPSTILAVDGAGTGNPSWDVGDLRWIPQSLVLQ